MSYTRRKKTLRLTTLLSAVALFVVMMPATASLQQDIAVSSASYGIIVSSGATELYWTDAAMEAAQEYPMRAVYVGSAAAPDAEPFVGTPGGTVGSQPMGQGNVARQVQGATQIVDGSAPVPLSASYPPPHSRWQYFAKYRTYPISTIGKVFFTQDHDGNGTRSNFVCSGSTIGFKYVLTAGHCVNNGLNGAGADGGWSTNFQICPSYDSSQGGVNPAVGCWTAYNLAANTSWIVSSNFDRDWGGAAMNQCSSRTPPGCTHVGSFVGWLGRAWNWTGEHFVQWGYPQASPFTGGKLIVNAAEWAYSINQGTGANSKYTGNDMTGGSSGGPWIFLFGQNNWADGVNSHKRCTQAGCPPGSILTEEMGSPPFTTEAGGSEDFFAFLFTL